MLHFQHFSFNPFAHSLIHSFTTLLHVPFLLCSERTLFPFPYFEMHWSIKQTRSNFLSFFLSFFLQNQSEEEKKWQWKAISVNISHEWPAMTSNDWNHNASASHTKGKERKTCNLCPPSSDLFISWPSNSVLQKKRQDLTFQSFFSDDSFFLSLFQFYLYTRLFFSLSSSLFLTLSLSVSLCLTLSHSLSFSFSLLLWKAL